MGTVVSTHAVTGSAYTLLMSDALPVTPEDIAVQPVVAADAGTSIMNLQARVPETGERIGEPDVFARFLPAIASRTSAVINITTGGNATMTVQDRLVATLRFKPKRCSPNIGSLNFVFFDTADRITERKHRWKNDYVVISDSHVFHNTFHDIAPFLETVKGSRTRFEQECYDVRNPYKLADFVDRRLVEPPFVIQTVFGILGGTEADPDNLIVLKQIADRLFSKDRHRWSVLAASRDQMPFATPGRA